MKPDLRDRNMVRVRAGISWAPTLKHRIYSCPDTPAFDFISGATALELFHSQHGFRLSLEVCTVVRLDAEAVLEPIGLPTLYAARIRGYLDEVGNNPSIIYPNVAHRFYCLGTEPWPDSMQALTASASPTEWEAVLSICRNSERYLRWPQTGELLWRGCTRTEQNGEHEYPADVLTRLGRSGVQADTRTNGPAIAAFLASGGVRPEGWHVHHVFDGTEGSPHAVQKGEWFTHSAGLVAADPVAHHLAHNSRLLKWLLWREVYLRFGHDPLNVFS